MKKVKFFESGDLVTLNNDIDAFLKDNKADIDSVSMTTGRGYIATLIYKIPAISTSSQE